MKGEKMTVIENEKNAIKKAIMDYYYEGLVNYDPELFKEIMHDQFIIFFYDTEGKLLIADRDKFLSYFDPQKADKNLKWEIEFYNIDVAGNVAAVKIRLESQKIRYIDFLNLVKTDNKWWIVNKLSHYDLKAA